MTSDALVSSAAKDLKSEIVSKFFCDACCFNCDLDLLKGRLADREGALECWRERERQVLTSLV